MFVDVVNEVSLYAIPVIILVICTYGVVKKVKVYEVFTEGAREGFYTGVRIIPFLVAMLVAIGVFRASGAMGYLAKLLGPLTELIGMPAEVLRYIIGLPYATIICAGSFLVWFVIVPLIGYFAPGMTQAVGDGVSSKIGRASCRERV